MGPDSSIPGAALWLFWAGGLTALALLVTVAAVGARRSARRARTAADLAAITRADTLAAVVGALQAGQDLEAAADHQRPRPNFRPPPAEESRS